MKQTNSRKHVYVIVLNWNGASDTCACLASLQKINTHDIELSVVVVDNGSTDESVEKINKEHPWATVLTLSENKGFSGGNNAGIRHALDHHADFIWLLNNDTVVDTNALVPLVDAFKEDSIGVAGSRIYFAPGREYHHERYREKDRGRVLWYAGGIIDWNNMYASHRGVDEVDRGQYDTLVETPFITGCSMMVKRNVLEAIGFLDEYFFVYLEDVDFCLRAKARGFRLIYVPSSLVWHKNAGSSGVGSALHQYYMTRNRLIVGMRYAPLRTKIALVRESLRCLLTGTSIMKQAVMDWFLKRSQGNV